MPDRYDPKLSLRAGDRRPTGSRRAEPGDDPLAELAKLVSGRPSGARGRPAAAHDPAASSSSGDVLDDLETELLNDLQASFAAVRDMVSAPPASAPPAKPEPAPQSPPVSVRSQPVAPPPQPPSEVRPEPDHHADTELPPPGLAERLAPQPPLPAFTLDEPLRIAETDPVEQPRAELRPPRPAPPPEPRFLSEQPAERPARPERSGDGGDFGSYRSRAAEPPAAAAPVAPSAPRPPRSRWEKPEAPVSRFAPPKPAAPPPRGPVFDDDDLDPYADLVPVEDEDAAHEFPLDGFGDLPADHDDDDTHDAEAESDLASMMEPRRSRTPLLVAGVIGLVLVGGIAVAMFRPVGGGVDEPPIIVADGAPTRITPDEPAVAEGEGSNKLIYDRVNPADGTAETTLLTPGQEPIAEVPADDAGSNPITRVIIPGGPGIDAPTDEGLSLDGQPSTLPNGGTQIASGGTEDVSEAIGPRRVRTVIVKPDGTIVDSTSSEVDDLSAGGEPQAAPAAEPAVTAAVEPPPVIAPPTPAPITDDTAAIAGTANGELAITPVPDADFAAVDEPPVLSPPAPEPAAQPSPAPAANVASTSNDAPADLQQSAAIPSGGMLVQVSSQRSEDAARATFRDLQARYPNILGPYDVNIQRADIPDRGTFYRVRVGPFSASDAQRLCNDLKSAGGDCILAQR